MRPMEPSSTSVPCDPADQPTPASSPTSTGTSATHSGQSAGAARIEPWRAAVIGACVGLASLVSSVRELFASGLLALAVTVVLLLASVLVLRGRRFAVDEDESRRPVFDAGRGSTMFLMVTLLGVSVVPMFVLGLSGTIWHPLAAGGLGVMVAVAVQAIVTRHMR